MSESTGSRFLGALSEAGYNTDGQAALASLVTSVVLTTVIALLFCFLRPYNSVVYAPRAKYADDKHAPPPVTKGLLAWIPPLLKTKEKDLVEKVGLDAAVFMRVCRMLRNIFTVLAVLGCGILIPNNLVGASKSGVANVPFFSRMTPVYLYANPSSLWAYVIVAWVFDFVIIYFLWANYRHVTRLRRQYFDSPEFQRSLHARTLMMTDIPKEFRSDEGIARIIDEVKVTQDHPRTAIARNVKDLPDLVEDYEETVKELEEHLAKYLKNPDRLPPTRPTCKVHKNDKGYGSQAKGQKVDAIEYLTGRIKELEHQIREVRQSVDRRDALSYGFASYESIPAAHSIAYAARNKKTHGATVALAPKPNDLVWKNLKMSRSQRARQNFINSVWIAVLTAAWTVPNLLIAVFLSNLGTLADFWPAFRTTYVANPTSWAIVQGVLAPAITMAFYFYLPAIFRKLCIKAGDTSKSSRERHVARSLYNFFFFNNLLFFSLFSTVFGWVANLIREDQSFAESEPLLVLLNGFVKVSTYWICWMLQRNLGAAVDLSQLFTLIWGSYSRRFLSPTPRRIIELSAPQALDYAGYYNYFLFYSTVAITFATVQPLILPVTAFYFWMDSFMKKYLILYVFITKYESGGMFWRSIYNRILFLTLFGNLIIALVIAANGLTFISVHWPKLAALVPLPVIVVAFKIYCRRTFDNEIHYYHMGRGVQDAEFQAGNELKKPSKGDRMAVRFGHPVLYRPLITPMVSSKSQHLLRSIYTGRTSLDDTSTVAGYSDVYMDNMDSRRPGKGKTAKNEPFELVDENNMDFENYKNRPEFRDEAGGDGELYGNAGDLVRPGTPSTMFTFSRAGTFDSQYSGHSRDDSGQSSLAHTRDHSRNISQQDTAYVRSRSESRDSERTKVGGDGENVYPRGYHRPTPSLLREQSPAGDVRPTSYMGRQESRDMLVGGAAGMGTSTPAVLTPGGYGPVRYGTPELGYDSDNDTNSYDYIRRGRTYPNA